MNFGPSVMTLPEWLRSVYPILPFKPIEVLQHPGEILFIPNGWGHAVLNIDEVVGIAFEIGPDMDLKDGTEDVSDHLEFITSAQTKSS